MLVPVFVPVLGVVGVKIAFAADAAPPAPNVATAVIAAATPPNANTCSDVNPNSDAVASTTGVSPGIAGPVVVGATGAVGA